MKTKLSIIGLMLLVAIGSFGCRKEFYNTSSQNMITNYWILDEKVYDDYDANSGASLGTTTVQFNSDSFYDFGRDGYYDGKEVQSGKVKSVGGVYTVINSNDLQMDYDGYTDQKFQIVTLTRTKMVLTTTYVDSGVETDETLYFYK